MRIWGLHCNDSAPLGMIETLLNSLTMLVALWHAARKIVPRDGQHPMEWSPENVQKEYASGERVSLSNALRFQQKYQRDDCIYLKPKQCLLCKAPSCDSSCLVPGLMMSRTLSRHLSQAVVCLFTRSANSAGGRKFVQPGHLVCL